MLAPETASPPERRLDRAAEMRLGCIPADLPDGAWRDEALPESWMRELDWALAELWDLDWTKAEPRTAIRSDVAQHREKSTHAGLKRALDLAVAVYDYEETAPFVARSRFGT